MSFPDSLIAEFLHLTTDFSRSEKQAIQDRLASGENPMNLKKIIAKNIIAQYHDKNQAEDAEDYFVNQFQNKKSETKSYESVPLDTIHHINNTLKLIDLCVQIKRGLSKTAIRRLIEHGAVELNAVKIREINTDIKLQSGLKIKIGKRDFYEITD